MAAIETEIPAEGSDAFRYYDCVGTDAQQFAQYCAFIEENRCYDTGITIQPGDRLIVLGDEAQGLALLSEKDFLSMVRSFRTQGE